jgi:hypothetical protein
MNMVAKKKAAEPKKASAKQKPKPVVVDQASDPVEEIVTSEQRVTCYVERYFHNTAECDGEFAYTGAIIPTGERTESYQLRCQVCGTLAETKTPVGTVKYKPLK